MCTPYNHVLCHFMQSQIRKVLAYLAATCYPHFWQNGRCLLRATAVTWGWNGYRNKSTGGVQFGIETDKYYFVISGIVSRYLRVTALLRLAV